MTLNVTMITGRIDVIRTALSHLQDLSTLSQEEFRSDYKNPATAETFLGHCLEAIFDIGRHILAKTGKVRLTHEYKDIARGLGEGSILSQSMVEKLVEMAGYRNRIVHFYHEITDEELYQILQTDLEDIRHFLGKIGQFLEGQKKRQMGNTLAGSNPMGKPSYLYACRYPRVAQFARGERGSQALSNSSIIKVSGKI